MTAVNGNATDSAHSAAFHSKEVRGLRTCHLDDSMVSPKARRRRTATVIRAASTAILLFAATGLAEWHPLPALLLAALAVTIQPCERPGRMPTVVSSGSSTHAGSTTHRFFSTGCRSLTAHTTATVSRALLADTLTNRWNGER